MTNMPPEGAAESGQSPSTHLVRGLHVDAELMLLAAEYLGCNNKINAFGHLMNADEVIWALGDQQMEIFKRMKAMPARTAMGLAAKLRVAQNNVVEYPDGIGDPYVDRALEMMLATLADAEGMEEAEAEAGNKEFLRKAS